MQTIIENLQDPSWWFTGLFFILLLKLVSWFVKPILKWMKSWSRNSRAKELKRIKRLRRKTWQIHHQIAIEQSYFLIFILSAIFFLVMLIATPLKEVFNKSIIGGLVILSPVLIIEMIWLKRNAFLLNLLRYAEKIS